MQPTLSKGSANRRDYKINSFIFNLEVQPTFTPLGVKECKPKTIQIKNVSFFDFYGRAVVMFKLMQMPNKNISSHEMTIANRDFIISDFEPIISSHEL